MPRKRVVGEYASCACCGEPDRDALRGVGVRVLCHNCADTSHARGSCSICCRRGPMERHHAAGRCNWAVTIPACLNCHAILSAHQRRSWPPDWTTGERPAFAVVVALLDILLLWLERGPVGPMEMHPDDGGVRTDGSSRPQGGARPTALAVLIAKAAPTLVRALEMENIGLCWHALQPDHVHHGEVAALYPELLELEDGGHESL